MARTRVSSWPNQQPGMFPALIIASLFRRVLKRAEKPATTEEEQAVSSDRVWFSCGDSCRKFACARDALETSSRCNEHVCAFTQWRAGPCCGFCFRGLSLGAGSERFTTIASVDAYRRESSGAQLRRNN